MWHKQYSCLLALSVIFFFIPVTQTQANPIWTHEFPSDAVLCLSTLPDISGDGTDEILAGLDSGRVVCLSPESASPATVLWSVDLDESVLAVLALPDANSDGWPEVVASTDKGLVTAFQGGGPNVGEALWTQSSTCGVGVLTEMQDRDSDGYPDLIFSGTDQRVHLVSGKTGVHIWNRFFSAGGYAYIHVVTADQDLNGDSVFDPVAWTWDGRLWAVNGVNGNDLWQSEVDAGFTEGMTSAGDVIGDTVGDFFAGGNSMSVKLCSGTDGSVVWTCALDRPVRDIIATEDVTGDGVRDGFACTAGGNLSCLSGAGSGDVSPVWTATIGDDVCRMLTSPGDCNEDGTADVVVCGENGVVACFSGDDGSGIWLWQGPDVVRAVETVNDVDGDGISEVVAACLDGTLALLSGGADDWPESFFELLHQPRMQEVPIPVLPLPEGEIQPVSRRTSQKPLEHPRLEPFAEEGTTKAITTTGASSVPILLYHDVAPEMFYYYGVSVANFRAQMDIVVQGNYTCVSLDLIADWLAGEAELPDNPICITFDGPYEGHHTWAYPILQERGLFAESYITSDWIGTANHCDWHQLREMDAAGIEDIQNHTANHPSLTSISEQAAIAQLQACSASLRTHMNKESFHHAYPGGSNNTAVRQILRNLGFKTATTVTQRHAVQTDDPMGLPRYSVLRTTSIAQFKTKIGYSDGTPTVTPTPTSTPVPETMLPYEYVGTVGDNWTSPSFADVDAEGKLWVCDYNAKQIRVFDSSGVETLFSPITQGLDQSGSTIPVEAPSGVAITPNGEVLVSICDYFGTQYLGLFRYRATDGQALNGWDLGYKVGDVDCDANGLVYAVNKVGGEWHVYTPTMSEISGSPFGPHNESIISRGISVRPDSSKVYIISETDRAVHVWEGGASESSASFSQSADLVADLSDRSGGVDVMDDGTVLIGYHEEDWILGFNAGHQYLGKLLGGTPTMDQPRGTAFTSDGSILWVACVAGRVQRWERVNTIPNSWLIY